MWYIFEKLIYVVSFVILHVDVHSPSERKIEVNLPYIFSIGHQVIVEETIEKSIQYELILPQLKHVTQYYKLHLKPQKCVNKFHHATASLIVPWAAEDYHSFVTEDSREPLHVRLQNSKPKDSNDTAYLKLTLDPNCKYHISVEPSIIGTLGQFARFYSIFLFPYAAVVTLMCLRHQLSTLGTEGRCNLVFTSLVEGTKPYFLLTLVKLFSTAISLAPLSKFAPTSDWFLMAEEGIDLFFLPLVLYLCAVGIMWLAAAVLASSLVLCESTVQKLFLRFLARNFTGFVSLSDYVLAALQKLPTVVALFLIALSMTTCGGLALCLGAGFYYLKLTQMSQEFVELIISRFLKKLAQKFNSKRNDNNIKKEKEKEGTSSTKIKPAGNKTEEAVQEAQPIEQNVENVSSANVEGAVFFHFTIFILWTFVSCMSVPSVLTWAHNFKYSTYLQSDPFFISGIVLSACAIPLWQLELPKKHKLLYREMSILIFLLAFAVLLYGTLTLYRLQFFLTVAIVLVTLHQIVIPSKIVQVSENTERDSYEEKVKAKLE